MGQTRIKAVLCVTVFSLAAAAPALGGGVFKNVLFGLTEAGFDFAGEENFLSGGADMSISRQFTGETLDFGTTELTLSGTPVITFSTGGRGLEVLDISFNTNNTPLNYILATDVGGQRTIINGGFFLDATASVNSFGWYDMQLEVASRQTITQDGRIVNDVTENDFDIGPINLRGNIYADLLASVTDPIFDLLGVENIFTSFSGAAVLESKLSTQAELALAKARSGESLTSDDIAQLASISAMGAALGLQLPDLSFLSLAGYDPDAITYSGPSNMDPNLIPEPTSLLLLALAAPALLRRSRKNRACA